MAISDAFKKLWMGFRVKKAIAKAETLHKLTRYNYIVINWKGKPVVIRKKDCKELIKGKFFKKGITVKSLELSCIYKTY